jgi:hypothetical protein
VGACGEKLCGFHHGHEVTAAGGECCCSPVDLEGALLFEDDTVDEFWIEDFGEVGLDESN